MDRADQWDEAANRDADRARELINLFTELNGLRQSAEMADREAERMRAEQAPPEIVAAYRILALEAEALAGDAERRYREAATAFQDIVEQYRTD